MARKQPVNRKVTFRVADLAGFLDMLRYDRATVTDWDHTVRGEGRDDRYEVTLLSDPDRTPGFEFTTDRWASFGLYLKDMEGNPAR